MESRATPRFDHGARQIDYLTIHLCFTDYRVVSASSSPTTADTKDIPPTNNQSMFSSLRDKWELLLTFSLPHPTMQVQQKTCPHSVTVLPVLSSRHNGHFRPARSPALREVTSKYVCESFSGSACTSEVSMSFASEMMADMGLSSTCTCSSCVSAGELSADDIWPAGFGGLDHSARKL